MKKITIVGTGHVGLVTGVCFAEIGHQVTCYDINAERIEQLQKGICPFFEPELDRLLESNLNKGRVSFTNNEQEAFQHVEIIYVTVGTPPLADGSVDLQYIKEAARIIGENITNDSIVVTKSTVPIGTNKQIKAIIESFLSEGIKVDIVSNPEFLREGSAIYDTLQADRIIIGAESAIAARVVEEINKPFNRPIFKTDLNSAEMIKYAANAFLAAKISFINEVANICEEVEANIEDVSFGMGLDSRIGNHHLKAGIGYGGSCFPKDIKALLDIASQHLKSFDMLKTVIDVNNKQQHLLIDKAIQQYGSLKGKNVALLGLAFKPNTDDIRESSAITLARHLIDEGAVITAYDPKAIEKTKQVLGNQIQYASTIESALTEKEMAFIATDWDEIKDFQLGRYEELMKTPILLDGRNCYPLKEVKNYGIDYISIGRHAVLKGNAFDR
ncbi:UDP-glucose dehydrogenase family protein [Bacillus lumedeiriae]